MSLKMWGESTIFLLNGDQEVFRLNAPEYVQAAMLSEDGKTLVVGVNRSIGSGSVFAVLLRVQPDGNNLRVGRVLESERKLFGNTAWGLTELGAVSNDGARLFAKFLVDGGDRWHTVDLTHSKILSEGLTMENAKNPK